MKWVFLLVSGLISIPALAVDAAAFKGEDVTRPQAVAKLPLTPGDGIIVAGQLNPGFHGRAATLEAKVLEIKDAPDRTHLIKVELTGQDAVRIWATTFVPLAKEQVKVGDRLMFKGYIATTDSMDSTGRLRGLTEGSAAVLQARTIETPK